MLKVLSALLTAAPLKGMRTEFLALLLMGGALVVAALGVWRGTLTVEEALAALASAAAGAGILTAKHSDVHE